MRLFLVNLTIPLFITFALLVGSIDYDPSRELLRQFECEPKPCWHDVYIGVTTIPEAISILSADQTIELMKGHYQLADTRLCWKWSSEVLSVEQSGNGCYSYNPGELSVLRLRYDEMPLQLGDVIDFLEPPIFSYFCVGADIAFLDAANARLGMPISASADRIPPEQPIYEITLYYPEADLSSTSGRVAWQRYSKWQDESPLCFG